MSVQTAVETALFNQSGSVTAFTSLDGKRILIGDATVRIEHPKTQQLRVGVWQPQKWVNVSPKGFIEKKEWVQFWDFFENTDTYYTPNNYRDIKRNSAWRRLYHVAPRNIWYVTPKETKDMNEPPAPFAKLVEETIYCKECGILTPLSSITIDHQRAQIGGGSRAIEKLFKACSLSRHEPKGRKGKYWSTGGSNPGFDLPMDDGNLPTVGEFTWWGVIFYSLIIAAGEISNFETVCLNHAVNLQPMCASCNTSKGNWAFV